MLKPDPSLWVDRQFDSPLRQVLSRIRDHAAAMARIQGPVPILQAFQEADQDFGISGPGRDDAFCEARRTEIRRRLVPADPEPKYIQG